jgi:predicted DCC family thiol-disulfide oxidoreductase YuxK
MNSNLKNSSAAPANTVYFNSACPVCRSGISTHRERLETCGLAWVDIALQPGVTAQIDATPDAVRHSLHVTDTAGRVYIGADALAVLWRHTPRLRWLAALICLPGVRTLARFAYNRFADGLFRWNVRRGHW